MGNIYWPGNNVLPRSYGQLRKHRREICVSGQCKPIEHLNSRMINSLNPLLTCSVSRLHTATYTPSGYTARFQNTTFAFRGQREVRHSKLIFSSSACLARVIRHFLEASFKHSGRRQVTNGISCSQVPPNTHERETRTASCTVPLPTQSDE